MCGIVGILNLNEPKPIDPESIARMAGSIRHRGPDEFGMFLDSWIGMGNVRLSIIDLNSGTQPISNEDETLWIVYNGEIFNYIELKEGLAQKGHRFKTESDTEVIVHLYEEYGPDCLQMLNGQFAFAIWDCSRREMFMETAERLAEALADTYDHTFCPPYIRAEIERFHRAIVTEFNVETGGDIRLRFALAAQLSSMGNRPE